MNHEDEALSISNPRLIAAIYFGVLAIIAATIIDSLLYAMGIEQMLPTFATVIWAAIIALCFGALFGKRIIHCARPFRRKAFLWGFLMVLLALPVYDLGFLYLLKINHAHSFAGATAGQLFISYWLILLYSLLLAGFWLALAAGFAALYLRGHLVYDILHSKYLRKHTMPAQAIKTKAAKHRRIHITH